MLKTLGVPHCDDDRWPSFDVVAYHDHCTDGIAAAAVVSLAVEGAGGSQPEFVPVYLDDVTRWLSDGACLLKSRTRAAQGLAKKAFLTKTLYGLPFRAVNATENISEVGEEILREFPDVDVACAFFQVGAGTIQLSFRSRAHQPGLQTALDAARELGGGGHEHAAGARMSLDEWPDFLWREG